MVLGALWKGDAINAVQMAEKLAFRGYDVDDYEIAIQAALELGWVEQGNRPDGFRLTAQGKQLREQAEQDTNAYFYAPWSVLTQDEIDELHELLTRLYTQLKAYAKSV
jgi:DNA-binding MarR family transcriptional regulator